MRFLPLYVSIGLAVCIGFYTPDIQTKSRLIGIWNALTPASNPTHYAGQQATMPATVHFQKSGRSIIGKPAPISPAMQLPISIELDFESRKNPKTNIIEPYILTISEDPHCSIGCPSDKICVVAKVQGSDSEHGKSYTCANTSVFYIKPGDLPFQWQNVMLFLGDDPEAQVKGHYPFKIGIAAWASTNGIWAKNELSAAPADEKTKAPQVKFNQPLHIFQGQQAWGGGPIPRMYYASIVHIYNNTDNVIMIRRTLPISADRSKDLSPYNFEKLVPPYSVVPFAMLWPSKISADQKDKVSTLPVELLIMGISKQRPLPIFKTIGVPAPTTTMVSETIPEDTKPGFEELNQANISETGGATLSDAELNSMINGIMQNASDVAQDISGYNELIDELRVDKASQYMVEANTYKIFSTTDPKNTLYIKECPIGSVAENIIYKHPTPAFDAKTGMPNFMRLIINEKDGNTTFDLKDISLESVYAQA